MQITSTQALWRTFSERRPLIMSIVVLGWSTKYLVTLAFTHTTGPEMYGVLTAGLSTAAAVANVVLLRSSRVRIILTGAVLVLWLVVALGGLAGAVAHVVGPVAGHGALDPRPRPIAAPLVFTLLGSVGATGLLFGQRSRIRRHQTEKE